MVKYASHDLVETTVDLVHEVTRTVMHAGKGNSLPLQIVFGGVMLKVLRIEEANGVLRVVVVHG